MVELGYDRVKGEHFYRAIGGGIHFGERAIDAARREWIEELGLELTDPRLVGAIENLFTYDGQPGHEIVFVFTARVRDARSHSTTPVDVVDWDGQPHTIEWIRLAELERGTVPLYPSGILDLIRAAECGEPQ